MFERNKVSNLQNAGSRSMIVPNNNGEQAWSKSRIFIHSQGTLSLTGLTVRLIFYFFLLLNYIHQFKSLLSVCEFYLHELFYFVLFLIFPVEMYLLHIASFVPPGFQYTPSVCPSQCRLAILGVCCTEKCCCATLIFTL